MRIDYTRMNKCHVKKGDPFCNFFLVPAQEAPSEKGLTVNGKQNAPRGRTFVPFRTDPDSVGRQTTVAFPESVLIPHERSGEKA